MRIAQVVSTFPPYMGGTGAVCYHNSHELHKLGHDVTVFAASLPKGWEECFAEFTVERINPFFRFRNSPFVPQLLHRLKNFDLVHLHYPYYFGGELVYLSSKLNNTEYLLTYHNDVIYGKPLDHIVRAHDISLAKKVINGSKRVCVHSIDYAKNSRLMKLLKDSDKLVEVPNGVDINFFNPSVDGSGIREKYLITDKKVILFVGGLDKAHYFKGVEHLLRSLKDLNNDTVLIIVGDGDLREYYQCMAAKLDVLGKTIFAGRVPSEELNKYYAASDLLVLPSTTMGEAFGIVLLEAMATQKAVIASNLPGVRTVVDDNINGLLFTPGNSNELSSKIQYLLDNEDVRRRFGRAGRKKVEDKYSWDRIGKKLEEIYDEV
jgi:glycosyltransferase involved in cell wall biosynthesis